jgi:hypothetical protein
MLVPPDILRDRRRRRPRCGAMPDGDDDHAHEAARAEVDAVLRYASQFSTRRRSNIAK